MDNIKILEEIGLKKVCDETHIEQKYLQYMVNNDYDKLDHINTLGFVKILSREYKIDLSAWLEAFEEYWIQNRQDKEDGGLFIVVEDKKSSKKLLIFILIVLVGVTFSMLFSLFQDKIDFLNYMNNDEATYEQTAIVQEVKESLDEINSSLQNSKLNENNITVADIVVEDINISNSVEEDSKLKRDLLEIEKDTEVVKSVIEKPLEKINSRFLQKAIISPNSPLWIGIIYLDTKKRISFLGEGNFSIDLSLEQIITTGHGSFDLTIGSEKREFKKQAPMRFLVKDTNLTEISLSKFKELNEGKPW
jgi:hypothetical protein